MDLIFILEYIILLNIFKIYHFQLTDKLKLVFDESFEDYIFTSDVINNTYLPEIGNGHIATQIKNKYIFMNGIYNGKGIYSHRARIPSTINWNVSSKDMVLKHIYSLDSILGTFKEVLVYTEYNITIMSYVSRVDRQILVRNISMDLAKYDKTIVLSTKGAFVDFKSSDFDFSFHELFNGIFIKGITNTPENNYTTNLSIFIYAEKIPKKIILNSSQLWMAFLTSMDSVDKNAFEAFNKAISHKSQLLNDHSQGWLDTWDDGLIMVSSSSTHVSRSIHAAQYYLLSSLPNKKWSLNDETWLLYGMSPTGLAHGDTLDDYLGHVFWDMDTWMFPVILPFHNSIALELIKYRKVMLKSAIQNSILNGYEGAQYPWESARTGFETTFESIYGKNEIHISADISLAAQQLLWMNSKHRTDLYYNFAKDIIIDIARFWRSRINYNKITEKYEILNVMPPDEYVKSCNNSAYTNIAAINSLEAPLIMAKRYGDNITKELLEWFHIAQNITYPYNKTRNFILEYEGYEYNQIVKQADVVLLQFPLQLKINEECFRNNLKYYEKITDVNGPAMTWSIFSINWLSLKDSLNGEKNFKKNLEYIISPFYVWSENIKGGGAINFLTGIGGYLQNILYGYMGMRLRFVNDGELTFDPILTETIKTIALHNISFHNSNIDIAVNNKELCIKLLNTEPIFLFATKSKQKFILTFSNNEITIERQKIILTSAS